MEYVKLTDTNSIAVPQVFLACNNPGQFGTGTAWAEIQLEVEIIVGT
jgi:hypothetical protein